MNIYGDFRSELTNNVLLSLEKKQKIVKKVSFFLRSCELFHKYYTKK